MKLIRKICSVVLVIAFAWFSTQSAALHVHTDTDHAHDADPHQHGPALHSHDNGVRIPVDETRVAADDDRDAVSLVRLSAASASGAKFAAVRIAETVLVNQHAPTVIGAIGIVARSHGPPSARPSSLRAPPTSSFL